MDHQTTSGYEGVPRSGILVDLDPELIGNISALIEEGQKGMVQNILADLHPADLAQVVSHLPLDEARQILRWLPAEPAGDLLAELDDDFRARLLEDTSEARLTAMIDELDSDDAADVLADLPEEVAEKVLPTLEDAEDVKELLLYDEDTAGGIMAAEYIAVRQNWSIAEAIEEVRRNAETVEDVFSVFVTDKQEHLLGAVSLKGLLLSPSSERVAAVMQFDVPSVTTALDQEEVALVMERYDLVTLPVVDSDGRLVGRITIDDVVDVIREEAEEDIQRMSGVAGGEEPTDSVFRIVFGRLPWLLVGLAGACLAAAIVWSFTSTIQAASVLAGFIPIIMATAGNAGIQSSAITVQRLAAGDMWASHLTRRLGKELRVALVSASVASSMLGLVIYFVVPLFMDGIGDPLRLALTATTALLIVIVQATALGTLIPLLLNRIGIDPALATGPFITTSNDIVGIVVFFLLAEMIYL